jgi:chaperone modulatory protein CbpM
MMLDAAEFCRTAGINATLLEAWVEAGWMRPRRSRNGWRFSAIELARAQLIFDLRGPMGVNEEGAAVILHLVDQIHGLRRALRGAASTASSQDILDRPRPRVRTG